MDREPQTIDELRARYIATKKRLGGVSGPTGVVPFERVHLPQDRLEAQDKPMDILQIVPPKMRFTAMLRELARMHNLDPNMVKSSCLNRDIVKVRQELFYRAVNELGLGYSQIGRMMQTTHSTVIYGVKAHKKRLAEISQSA
jgi:hypothetical protein